MKSKVQKVMFRRKREGKTNYKKRLNILISNKARLVVRRSLKSIQASVIEYNPKGDKVIASVNSRELGKIGWTYNKSNMPSAYLTGFLLGNKAKKKGINELVLDIGLNGSVIGSKIYAVLSGVLDAGINIAHNEKVLPSKERITGKHISEFASKIKGKEEFGKQFSGYAKNNINPEDIGKYFEEVKNKISGGQYGGEKQSEQ